MGLLDSVGNGLEGLYQDGKKAVGSAIDQNAHAVGGMLDFVGLHDAAHAVDKFGDQVVDDLGAQIGELQLGDTEDPKDLVHGDVKAITESVGHLRAFHDAFAETGGGLRALDSDHWQGQAAEAFRAKFAPHPTQWLVAADACAAAAKALDDFSHTVSWAQDQAKQAIDAYNAAKKAHQQAQDTYNASVDSYNKAVKTWNDTARTNPNPGPKPTDPGDFHDPSTDQLTHAQDLLRGARTARDTAADTAAAALKTATDTAPAEPDFTERMKLDAVDLYEGGMDGVEHLGGGIVKGAADIVKFGRGLNPMDVYNITHPALYLDHVNTVAAGLVHVGVHPTQLLTSLAGSGWGSDPFEAGGKFITNTAFGIATGGGGEVATVSTDVGMNAARDTAENAAQNAAKDAAENAGRRAGASAAQQAPDRLAASLDRNVDLAGLPGNVVWRDSSEALYRLDDRTPQEIMRDQGLTARNSDTSDLRGYVLDNKNSAFVGTTRDPAGMPDFHRNYLYEVDAPGGVDVNASIPDNPHGTENEVAFPGGIKLEHIRSWREFDAINRTWGPPVNNPYYRPTFGSMPGRRPAYTAGP